MHMPQILDSPLFHFQKRCICTICGGACAGVAPEFDYRKRVSFSLDRHSHDTLVRRPGSVRATGFQHMDIYAHFAHSHFGRRPLSVFTGEHGHPGEEEKRGGRDRGLRTGENRVHPGGASLRARCVAVNRRGGFRGEFRAKMGQNETTASMKISPVITR